MSCTNESALSFSAQYARARRGGDGGKKVFHLQSKLLCQTAKVGTAISEDENMATYRAVRESCQLYPWRVENSFREAGKRGKRATEEDQIYRLKCLDKKCPMEYVIKRRNGGIALYRLQGAHIHQTAAELKAENTEGLTIEAKKIYLSCLRSQTPVAAAYRIISTKSDDERNRIVHPDDFPKLKKKLANFSRSVHKTKWIDTPATPCGRDFLDTMDVLLQWVQERKQNISVFASITKNELDVMDDKKLDEFVVLDTDIGEQDDHSWTYLVVSKPRFLRVFDSAIAMSRKHCRRVQSALDSAEDLVKNSSVGVRGYNDFFRRFHPTLYDVNNSENGTGASRASIAQRTIFRIRSEMEHSEHDSEQSGTSKSPMESPSDTVGLSDGRQGLITAVKACGQAHQQCFSHQIRCSRSPSGKEKGSGTKGSFLKFLQKKKCSDTDINICASVFLSVRHIPSEEEWKSLRPLLMDFTEKNLFLNKGTVLRRQIINRMFGYYFTDDLKWGYAYIAGETHSTYGLEGQWPHRRIMGKNDAKKNKISTTAFLDFISSYNTRITNSAEFEINPRATIKDWEWIAELEMNMDIALRLSVFYDSTSKLIQSLDFIAEDNSELLPFTVYIPTKWYLNDVVDHALGTLDPVLSESQNYEKRNPTAWLKAEKLRNHVLAELGSRLCDEVPYALNGEDMIDFIMRRGIRRTEWHHDGNNDLLKDCWRGGSNKKAKYANNELKAFLSETKELVWNNEKLEELKGAVALEESELEVGEENVVENEKLSSEQQKEKGTMTSDNTDTQDIILQKANMFIGSCSALGSFAKVVYEAPASRHTSAKITCTCDRFRRDGTCDHSRFFGLLCGEQYPEPKAVRHDQRTPWKDIRLNLIAVYKKKYMWTPSRMKESALPPIDPWTSSAHRCNSTVEKDINENYSLESDILESDGEHLQGSQKKIRKIQNFTSFYTSPQIPTMPSNNAAYLNQQHYPLASPYYVNGDANCAVPSLHLWHLPPSRRDNVNNIHHLSPHLPVVPVTHLQKSRDTSTSNPYLLQQQQCLQHRHHITSFPQMLQNQTNHPQAPTHTIHAYHQFEQQGERRFPQLTYFGQQPADALHPHSIFEMNSPMTAPEHSGKHSESARHPIEDNKGDTYTGKM